MFHRTRYGWWFSNQHSLPAGYIEIPGSARTLSDLGAGRRAAYRPLLWIALRAWDFLSAVLADTLEDDHRK